jgi:hypothetical protein
MNIKEQPVAATPFYGIEVRGESAMVSKIEGFQHAIREAGGALYGK